MCGQRPEGCADAMNSDPVSYDERASETNDETTPVALRRWVIVRHATIWRPPTDVYELEGRLIVVVEIAGMRDSDFSVVLQEQQLVISGVRQRFSHQDCAYHQLEIPYGEFRTEVSLPWAVARDDVSAMYRDGFLRVELPRAPIHRITVIDVSEASAAGPEPADDSEEV